MSQQKILVLKLATKRVIRSERNQFLSFSNSYERANRSLRQLTSKELMKNSFWIENIYFFFHSDYHFVLINVLLVRCRIYNFVLKIEVSRISLLCESLLEVSSKLNRREWALINIDRKIRYQARYLCIKNCQGAWSILCDKDLDVAQVCKNIQKTKLFFTKHFSLFKYRYWICAIIWQRSNLHRTAASDIFW